MKKNTESVYADLLEWTLTNYHHIVTKVEPDTDDAKARQAWCEQCSVELDKLYDRWGVKERKR
jgi:hypothetical protein